MRLSISTNFCTQLWTALLSCVSSNVSQILVPWKCFGSNGLKTQPVSVIESFIYHGPNLNNFGKGIIRPSHVLSARHHECVVKDKTIAAPSSICLNHYMCQSWEWYTRVKMMRGDAAHAQKKLLSKWDHNHYAYKCESNFRKTDQNSLLDRNLLIKRGSYISRGLPIDRNWPTYGVSTRVELRKRNHLVRAKKIRLQKRKRKAARMKRRLLRRKKRIKDADKLFKEIL